MPLAPLLIDNINLTFQANKIPADSNTGRFLMDLIDSVPQIDRQEFDTMLNANMKVRS